MLYTANNRPLQTIVSSPDTQSSAQFLSSKDEDKYIPYKVFYSEKELKNTPNEWNPFENKHKDFYVESINQGQCGSCWAFSSVTCLTDRINIFNKKKVLSKTLSPNLLLICNIFSNFFIGQGNVITGNIDYETNYHQTGCYGNHILSAIYYLFFFGTSDIYCYPYDIKSPFKFKEIENNLSFYPFERNSTKFMNKYFKNKIENAFVLSSFSQNIIPCAFYIQADRLPIFSCINNVTDNNHVYGTPYNGYFITYFYNVSVEFAKYEIFKNGPIVTSFIVYEDFYTFNPKNEESVYIHNPDNKYVVGGHAVEVVGWGETEKGVPFWWVRNMWGSQWGRLGFFKFFRGNNQCEFESNMIGFLPNFKTQIPLKNFKNFHQTILKKFNLKPKNPDNFLNVVTTILNTPFFLAPTKKQNETILKKLFQRDFEQYGCLFFQVYKKIGILSTRMTDNNFDYRALQLLPNLDIYKDSTSVVDINQVFDGKKDTISIFSICLFVGVFIIIVFFILFWLIQNKK